MTNKPNTNDQENLSCLKIEAFIDDYLENKLPSVKREVFESHIDFCPSCLIFLTNYRNAVILGKAAYAGYDKGHCTSMPKNLVEAILRASEAK